MVHLSKTPNQVLVLIMSLSIIQQLHTTLLSIKTTTVSLSALIAVLEYTTVPFGESFCRNFENIRGIGIIEMPFRRNILAFVGHGDHPKYPRNKVMIWDDQQSRCIHELCFWSEVRRIRLLKDCLVVVLEHKIFV